MRRKKILFGLFLPPIIIGPSVSILNATSLSLGADYFVRGVSVKERDKTVTGQSYFDQRLQTYLVTDLSQDVEATLRIQSITPWGLEGSTNPLFTRYPHANGNLWVQNAFVRLPGIWNDRIILTVGRQPLTWGDGMILSDDDLGFNAIRLQLKSPWKLFPLDGDAFGAKITEGLTQDGDTNLTGVVIGGNRDYVRWDLMSLWENNSTNQNYQMGADTVTFNTSKVSRQIIGIRAKANLKDAYMKGEYYIQKGSVRRTSTNQEVDLGGSAYLIGLGGKSNTTKFGRFGALLELAVGSGDDPNTGGEDEAFRPTFASRWSGLERKGYGRYLAATVSDVYSPTTPFAPVTSSNTGLPAGTSGIQSVRFGLDATPFPQWTFTFDFFQYKAQKNLAGPKELGTEFDYGFVYRYSGLVTIKGSTNVFKPGEAFDEQTKTDGKWSSIELAIKF